MSFKHHVGVQYVLQYCNYYRSTFGIKKFSFSLVLKKGCVLQCIAVTNKELWYVHKIKNIPIFNRVCKCTATFFLIKCRQQLVSPSKILACNVTPDPNVRLKI